MRNKFKPLFGKLRGVAARYGNRAAVALAVVPVAFARPVTTGYPTSFSIDLSGLLDMADTIFSGLSGAFVPIWGIVLGLGLLALVGGFIMKAVNLRK